MPKSTIPTDAVTDALAAITRATDALFKHTTKAASIDESTSRTIVVIGAAEVGVPSGVLYGAALV